MEAKLFDDYENEKRLLALMQNKQEFEKYILAKHNSSPCDVPFDPFIWAVHFNIPKNNRFSTLEYIFQQSFSYMKTSYSFLPDKQVIGITYTALGIPTICGEPDKCFLKAHKKFKMYYPTKRPSKLRKPPIAISKNKYYTNKKRNTMKKTTDGCNKSSNLSDQGVENEPNKPQVSTGIDSNSCFEEQTPIVTTLPRPNHHDDRQMNDSRLSSSPEQSPLVFISRDPKFVDNCSSDHEMVTPKLEKHRRPPPSKDNVKNDHSVCSMETVKLTRSQTMKIIETQNNDTLSELYLDDSETPLGYFQDSMDIICITTTTEGTDDSKPAAELSPQRSDNVLSSEEILIEDFNRFISSDDMANEIDEIVLGSSTSGSSLVMQHSRGLDLGGSPTDSSSLEMIIIKNEQRPFAVAEADVHKSETSTLSTSSSLNLQQHQRSLIITSSDERWSTGSRNTTPVVFDRPNQSYMDFEYSAAGDSWLEMKINFSSMSFSDSVGSTAPKTANEDHRKTDASDRSSIDAVLNKSNDNEDSWENAKNDIKWSLGFESENPISSWTSSSDIPKHSSSVNNGNRPYDNSVGTSSPSSPAASDSSEGLERINSDFMSWSSTSIGGTDNIANTSTNPMTNALFRNFSFEDSLYLQMNSSNSSTNNESSSLVGIVKMANNIKKTLGS